jgi:hypothetical protein
MDGSHVASVDSLQRVHLSVRMPNSSCTYNYEWGGPTCVGRHIPAEGLKLSVEDGVNMTISLGS